MAKAQRGAVVDADSARTVADALDHASFAAIRAPRQILFGAGQRCAAGWNAAQHGSRALVVVDPYLAEESAFAEVLTSLHAEGIATTVYTGVVPEIPSESIGSAHEAARTADADVLVAVGGGSSIDLAKLTAVLLAHGGDVSDYYGENRVPGPTLPVVALPTTAGTGSEVTPVAVLTDRARGSKVGVSSPYLIPVAAICDPELTYTCPPDVTAMSGADAISHCIEAYTAVRRPATPVLARERVFVGRGTTTDTFALTGLAHLVAGLRRAYENPGDAEARGMVMYGSLMAGLAFGTAGTAAAHALQYPVGALTGTPHGVGVGLLLPYVMELNRPARTAELAQVARVLGSTEEDRDRLAADAPRLVAELLAGVGIPRDLAALGLAAELLDRAAAEGLRAARLAENNPVPLTEAAARRILRAAWEGDLGLVSSGTDGDLR